MRLLVVGRVGCWSLKFVSIAQPCMYRDENEIFQACEWIADRRHSDDIYLMVVIEQTKFRDSSLRLLFHTCNAALSMAIDGGGCKYGAQTISPSDPSVGFVRCKTIATRLKS